VYRYSDGNAHASGTVGGWVNVDGWLATHKKGPKNVGATLTAPGRVVGTGSSSAANGAEHTRYTDRRGDGGIGKEERERRR